MGLGERSDHPEQRGPSISTTLFSQPGQGRTGLVNGTLEFGIGITPRTDDERECLHRLLSISQRLVHPTATERGDHDVGDAAPIRAKISIIRCS